MTANLEIAGGVVSFGGNRALDGVELSIAAGEVHAVIGPNGAGKSTLFGALAGEHRLDAGAVRLDGADITRLSAQGRVRRGIGRAFQVARVFPALSVTDNVSTAVLARRRRSAVFWTRGPVRAGHEEAQELLSELGLGRLSNVLAGDLSQGDRKRLEIATVLALRPRVLLLDEPTAGMSPEETDSTVELVRGLWADHSLTVLITEHDMDVVFGIAQTVTVLHRGRVLCSGDPSSIRSREDVAEVYLGSAQ